MISIGDPLLIFWFGVISTLLIVIVVMTVINTIDEVRLFRLRVKETKRLHDAIKRDTI